MSDVMAAKLAMLQAIAEQDGFTMESLDNEEFGDWLGWLEKPLAAATPIIQTEALTLDELEWVMRYLMRAGLKEGLLLADMLNQKFGASARRRGSAWPVANG